MVAAATGGHGHVDILHSAEYPPETKVEVKTLADGRVRLIVRGPRPKTKK